MLVVAGSEVGQSGSADGAGHAARFQSPTGIALDPRGDGRDLLVCDHSNGALRRVRLTGDLEQPLSERSVVYTLARRTEGGASLSSIRAISSYCATADCFYLTASSEDLVCEVTLDPSQAVARVRQVAKVQSPRAVAVASNGEVYVACASGNAVRRLVVADASGGQGACTVSTLCGGSAGDAPGRGEQARFRSPTAFAWTPEGALLMADEDNHKLWQVR